MTPTHRPARRRLLGWSSLLALALGPGCGGDETSPSPDAPVIASITPAFGIAGEFGLSLEVSGQRFHDGSVLLWNGVPVPTVFLGPETLGAVLGPGELRRAGTARLTVDNGVGQGGMSSPRDFPVRYPIPAISAVSPSEVIASAGPVRLTVTGSRFFGATRGRWNGAERPTVLLEPGILEVELNAADLNSPGPATLTLSNPGPGGGTSSAFVVQVTRSQSITAQRVINLQVNALLGDPARGRLIAATAAVDPVHPNRVLVIAAATGTVTGGFELPFEPGHLAMSADGRYIYAASADQPLVSRVDLVEGAVDLSFSVAGFAQYEPSAVGGIAVVPGEPTAVLVAIRSLAVTPDHEGYVVFAEGQPRPERLGRALRSNFIAAGAAAGRLLGSGETGTLTIFQLQVDGNGVHLAGQRSYPGLSGRDFATDSGAVIFDTGTVIDLVTGDPRGTFGLFVGGTFASDVSSSRFYHFYPGVNRVAAYDLQRFSAVGAVNVPGIGQPQGSLARWSRTGLAFRTVTQVILLETTQAN